MSGRGVFVLSSLLMLVAAGCETASSSPVAARVNQVEAPPASVSGEPPPASLEPADPVDVEESGLEGSPEADSSGAPVAAKGDAAGSVAATEPEPEPAEPTEPAEVEMSFVPSFEGGRPTLVSMPVPEFPAYVDFDRIVPGWVEASVQIDESGDVIEVEIVDASAEALIQPAEEALRQARYDPVIAPNGFPIRVRFQERLEF